MGRLKLASIILALAAFLTAFSAQYPVTAEELIKKVEEKFQGDQTTAQIEINIQRPKWTRTMNIKTWSKGSKYSMSLITAPARDRGTVFLKRDKEVWNWIPTVERTIKLPPSMMSQSWMGTDLTNDDMVRESSMVNDFNHKLLGKETVGGVSCYKIESIAKEDAAVVWGKVIFWVDPVHYIQMKAEMYDEDGELVNTFISSNVKNMGGRMVASRMEIIPADKADQKTTFEYKSLDFTTPISEDFFTVQNMKRIKP